MRELKFAAAVFAIFLNSACSGSVSMSPLQVSSPAASAPTGGSLADPVIASTSGNQAADNARKAVQSVRVTPDSFVISVGEARDLLATVQLNDGTFDSNVTWSSSDSRILEVNPTTGRISARAEGVASIVASALFDPTKRATVTVTVRKGAVQEAVIRLDPASATLAVGETRQLTASVQMSDGSTSPNVRWESSNQAVVLVSGTGLVTAVGKGRVVVTAMAAGDSTRRATCEITVE